MTRVISFRLRLMLAVAISLSLPLPGRAQQTAVVQSRITQAIDENQLTVLRGNTHPLARPQFDRGAAPPDLAMNRMLLVLKRSSEQDAALSQLLEAQQDKSSPNYHKWLTPVQFGKQFGPSDDDIQTITSWLGSHGFQVDKVSNGRTVIEFSGNASQVKEAFHTEIHKYIVNGEDHWANSSDPQIPSALAPVVAGIATLHNFYKKPQVVYSDQRFALKHIEGSARPQVTFPGGVHALGPDDYATIYDINPLYKAGINGAGTTIAVVGRSNIQLQDVIDFQTIFQLTASPPNVILNGRDPGILPGGEQVEATLDSTWSGAVAPGAQVDFVVSASTNNTDGVDLSEIYIIDNNLGNVMTESFGGCEFGATQAEAASISSLAEQAAAQGITYMVSSGDSGAEGCDANDETVATGPISVNILSSTPFTVAVGGTQFNEGAKSGSFWSTSPPLAVTALSYIPEDVWNESCTGAPSSPCGTDITKANILAGGGGVSTLFKKPVWQASVAGIPSDGARDVPDVSLTAAGHDPYLLCVQGSCEQNEIALVLGTSASAPSFAGMMAMVNQKTKSRQGQANYVLYRLAAAETLSKCNASSQTALPATTCIFHDVTMGNNAVPGEKGFGISGAKYQSTVGYDLATGLGSVNAANLVNEWGTARSTASDTTLTLNPASGAVHGSVVDFTINVAAAPPATGTATGDVDLSLPPASQFSGVQFAPFPFLTLTAGSASSSTNQLPGGTYNLTAHYEGDGTFVPSDSALVPVSISPELTTTAISASDSPAGPSVSTYIFGNPIYFTTLVSGSSGVGAPTGLVNFVEPSSGAIDTNVYAGLSPQTSSGIALSVGSHSILASYVGDASFQSSKSGTITLTVQKAQPVVVITQPGPVLVGTPANLDIVVTGTALGGGPTGTVSLFNGSTLLSGPINVGVNSPGSSQGVAIVQLPLGQITLTAKYSGDTNYLAATSAPATINVVRASTTTVTSSNLTVQQGTNVTFTATVAPAQSGGPSLTGSVTFIANGGPLNAPIPIANGQAQISTTSFPVGSDQIAANYSGDSNYGPSSATLIETVNPPPSLMITAGSNINIASPGQSGSTGLTFTAQNGFTGTIGLSPSECSGLPAESTCSFSASSVTLSSTVTAASANVTVATTAASNAAPLAANRPWGNGKGWEMTIGILMLLLLLSLSGTPKRQRWSVVFTLLAFATVLTAAGCGGGSSGTSGGTHNPGTPQGNSTVTLTFTVNGAAQTVPVSVTVN